VLRAARCKYRTQKIAKKSTSGHHPTTLSGYIFATKACIDNRKKNLLSSNMSSTCPHNMVNFGPLAAEICWRIWGTPANQWVSRVGSVTARVFVRFQCSVSAKLYGIEQRAPPGQGGHHVGHWSTFLVHHFLGQFKPTIQTASGSVQLFSHWWPQSVPPPQNCPCPWGIWAPPLESNIGPLAITQPKL